MKSELRLGPHAVIPDATVVEVWYDGEFVATVCGADGPGVRVVSKHRLVASPQESAMTKALILIGVQVKE